MILGIWWWKNCKRGHIRSRKHKIPVLQGIQLVFFSKVGVKISIFVFFMFLGAQIVCPFFFFFCQDLPILSAFCILTTCMHKTWVWQFCEIGTFELLSQWLENENVYTSYIVTLKMLMDFFSLGIATCRNRDTLVSESTVKLGNILQKFPLDVLCELNNLVQEPP